MMTVLNVLNDERFGGPQSRVLLVAARLRDRGIQTIVVIPPGDPVFASLLERAGVRYEEVDLGRPRQIGLVRENLRFVARFWSDVGALRHLVQRHKAHLVHVNKLLNLQAAIAARLEGTGLVWHLNEARMPRIVHTVCLPICRAWADRIAVSSKAAAAYYFADGKPADERLHLLYPPVDSERFYPGIDGAPVRKELGIGENSPIIGMVGNVHPGKGIDLLLEAAPRIRAAFPATKILIVGDLLENRRRYWLTLMKRVRALGLADDFLFLGRRYDVPQVLSAFSVYVHASRTEAASMAVLEASASGLPVVATDVGGAGELVENGVTGVLVAPESPELIAAATIRLLAAPDLARQMGRAGTIRVRDLFSLEACVSEHVRLYRTALDQHGQAS